MGSNRSVMARILTVLTLLGVSSALDMSIISYEKSGWRSDETVMSIYERWLVKHGKVYNSLTEKDKRFQIFKDNLNFINEHNAENRTYKVGLNRFADLSNHEYRANYLGTKIDPKRMMTKTSYRYAPRVGDNLPESVDWRKEGAVVRVKDQDQCVLIELII
ncbi:Cysteine proteinase RD21A, partial [Mucuna pruriens]